MAAGAAADRVARAAAAARAGRGGGGYGGQGGRGGRGGYGGGAGRGDVEQHGRDGSFRSSVRIIGLEALEDAVRGNEKAQESDGGNGETASSEDLARNNS